MPLFNYPSAPHWTQAASLISLPFAPSNKSLGASGSFWRRSTPEDVLRTNYVKLRPGSKIYFYTTEDENLMIGPKLQSEEDVSILLLDQDEDLKEYSQFKSSYIRPDVYSVLKSGVLVPKNKSRRVVPSKECNKCVYQSTKPTYYIKGFKDILIPVDVLYSKSTQDHLFNGKDLGKTIGEFNSWRTDLKLSEPKAPPETRRAKCSTCSHAKGRFRPPPLNIVESEKKKPSFSDEDVLPDKNCNGDVTLFVLNDDGVLKRMPSDPFLPAGVHLSYSLLGNFMLKPKFLENSDVQLSYITGENGDLIPHSENVHKVEAIDGDSVSFLMSKSGGLIPVKEEKDENQSISYYFNGNLVHKSRQFTETFSNSTSVLINNKKLQIFESVKEGKQVEGRKHHLQKRNAYYNNYDNNYDRGVNNPGQPSVLEPMRQPVMEYQGVNNPGQPPVLEPVRQPVIEYQGGRNQPMMRQFAEPPMVMERKPEALPVMHAPLRGYEAPPPPGPMSAQGPMPPPHPGRCPPPPPPPSQHSVDNYPENPPMDQRWENQPLVPRSDVFIFDEKGTRIRLIPEITEGNDVVIYKLTCKGNLIRYPPCKEPEFGFNIHFQLLLDEFVLVPRLQDNKPCTITYVLQENGDLIPAEGNVNTFRKAPGSLIYYMLGKNNILFPVQQIIDLEGNVSFYYHDYFLLKMKDSMEKPLHFSTRGSPLFAFYNGFTVITISSRPRLNPLRGSNWRQLKPSESEEGPPKTMYLTGPKGELIKLVPYKNKQGSTVVYELDCNGIFYRSPKDKKKCIILRSYILLKEGILLPSNDTSGYVYMMSKNGDLFPYLYPDGKIEAPLASSLKYVLCEKGILLPIKLEIIDNYICYLFRDVVVYKERVYCRSCLDRMDEDQLEYKGGARKSSCDSLAKDSFKSEAGIKLFVNKDGDYVFYERDDKILRRHPSEAVPSYLKYTMGSFEIKSDGSLHQIRYQDPNENVINLMLEPNGDLLEDTRNINKARSDYYVLDARGNLIAVEARKTKRHLHFYKNQLRVCRVRIPDLSKLKNEIPALEERVNTPLGKDPLKLLQDPLPGRIEGSNDTRSLYIPIPLKSVSISEPEACAECGEKKKYEMLKDTLTQMSKGSSLPLALELELTDDIMDELKNWAAKCDKILTRREISEKFKDYIKNFNFINPKGENVLDKMNL